MCNLIYQIHAVVEKLPLPLKQVEVESSRRTRVKHKYDKLLCVGVW